MVAAAEALMLTGEQRDGLERLARSHTAPVREVRQAKALLWAAEGVSNAEIARRWGATTKSVRRWRSRFCAEGVASVGRIRRGRGRPAKIDASVVAAVVHDTLHAVPDDGSVAWSTRTLGARHGVGKDTVARHTGEATKALLDAECLAPEHVWSHHLTHGTIRDLIDRLGRRAPTDLVELARRSGAMP